MSPPIPPAVWDALDAVHAADPVRVDGEAAELRHVRAVERWVGRLTPQAGPALRLAARAQHLERWAIPRDRFPLDRAGYHRWRRAVQQRQGDRVREILTAAGCDAALAERVALLVAKTAPAGDADAQALEDAACLTFLEDELAAFAAGHADYPREKFVAILRRTWVKMSPAARALAGTIPLPDALAALVREATA
jgi:tRNAThr (cytosine32-N3)-methyltransferase